MYVVCDLLQQPMMEPIYPKQGYNTSACNVADFNN